MTAPAALPPTRVVIKGPFPPPSGLVGPFARTTESHVYQIWKDGRQLMGGSFGPDPAACRAYALRMAAEKGLTDPPVILLPASPAHNPWRASAHGGF